MSACTLEEALARANTTGTMLEEHELCFLYALAAMAPRGPAVELGVYKGGSLSVWCGARHPADEVFGVDNWEPPKWDSYEGDYYAQIERHGLDVTTLKMKSWDAANCMTEVAFCFVDSTHNHTGFPADLDAWVPMIMPGGIIVFHDYGSWKADIVVKELVDEWQNEAQWFPLGLVGSAIAFMRPRGHRIGGRR